MNTVVIGNIGSSEIQLNTGGQSDIRIDFQKSLTLKLDFDYTEPVYRYWLIDEGHYFLLDENTLLVA